MRAEEVAAIPVLQREVGHAVYGPLADFPLSAEIVLLFAHAQQGLILSEAAARVDEGVPAAMGRPACAVVPQVVNQGRAAMSLGCCGARAYLDAMSDDVALWALPAGNLEAYCKEIGILANANTVSDDVSRTPPNGCGSGTAANRAGIPGTAGVRQGPAPLERPVSAGRFRRGPQDGDPEKRQDVRRLTPLRRWP